MLILKILSIMVGQYVVNPSINYGTVVDGRDGLTCEICMQKDILLEEWISQKADFRLDLYRASIFSLNLDNINIC